MNEKEKIIKKQIIELINYELNFKNTHFTINEDFFNSFDYKNIFKNKETILSIYEYYKFLNNDNSIKIFIKIYEEITIIFQNIFEVGKNVFENRILKENDTFLLTILLFYNKNLNHFILFYTLIIFKSLTTKFFYDKTSNYLFDKYEHSDIIISKAVYLFENFFIFYEIDFNFDFDNLNRELRAHFFAIFEFISSIGIIDSKLI
jgi:hypothetical protein